MHMSRGAALVDVMIASSLFVASFLGATKLYYTTLQGWRSVDQFVVVSIHGQQAHITSTTNTTQVTPISGNDTITLNTSSNTSSDTPNTRVYRHEVSASTNNAMLTTRPFEVKRYSSKQYDVRWSDIAVLSPSVIEDDFQSVR